MARADSRSASKASNRWRPWNSLFPNRPRRRRRRRFRLGVVRQENVTAVEFACTDEVRRRGRLGNEEAPKPANPFRVLRVLRAMPFS
jgi:hypothetical protein